MVLRPRRVLSTLVVLSAAVYGTVLPAAAAPGAPGDVLSVGPTSEWEDVVGLYASSELHDVVTSDQGPDTITVDAGPSWWKRVRLVVGAPLDRPTLAVGRYAAAAEATPLDARLTLVDHAGCSAAGGTFDVLDVAHDADGRLSGLALDYSVECAERTVRGTLRWNSDEPYRLTDAGESEVLETPPGVPVHLTFQRTNAGSVAQTLGATTADQGAGAVLRVVRDRCAGVTLAPGERCTIEVSAVSDGTQYSGYVRTPDQSPVGEAVTWVALLPGDTPAAPVLIARVERGGVMLSTRQTVGTYRVLRASTGVPEVAVADAVELPWADTDVQPMTAYTYRIVQVVDGAAVNAPSEPVTVRALPAAQGAEGQYVPVEPVRVADTRDGTGVRRGAVGPGETVTIDPARSGDVPRSGVMAVLLNVTGTEPTAPTSLRVWAAGEPLPGTSSLNLARGETRPNQVVVPVGADGRVSLNNGQGSVHLVVDVQGFYSSADGPEGGGYHLQDPVRALDTRERSGAFRAFEERWVPLTGVAAGATAVDLNLTVTQPTRPGHLVAWSGQGGVPNASHVNFVAGQTIANHVVVPVAYDEGGAAGIVVRNHGAGQTHVIVDVQGWYDEGGSADGLRFVPMPPTRLTDTRVGGSPANSAGVFVPGSGLRPGVAHVVNVTATEPVGAGHLIAWSGDGPVPGISTVNYVAGETAPNLATVRTAPGGSLSVSTRGAAVHIIVDHVGVFY